MKLKKYPNVQKEHDGDQLEKNVFLRDRNKVRDKDKLAEKQKVRWATQGVKR
jgi:hypothetical protein